MTSLPAPVAGSSDRMALLKAAGIISAVLVVAGPIWFGAIRWDRSVQLEKRVESLEAISADMRERLVRIDENVQQLRRDNRARAASIP